MVKIVSKRLEVQAEGLYANVKLVGNSSVGESGTMGSVSGSIYKKENDQETYIGGFNCSVGINVNIDNKENAVIMSEIVTAISTFSEELKVEIEGGAV